VIAVKSKGTKYVVATQAVEMKPLEAFMEELVAGELRFQRLASPLQA
jgi:hypothetical protein